MDQISLVTARVVRRNEQYGYKLKGKGEQYLVRHQEGENPGDKVVEYLQPFAIEPIIIEAVRLEKGVDFLNQEEERERNYKCTVAYIVLNESTGKESKVRKGMYLYADDCQEALNCVEKSFGLAESAGVVSIAQTKIIELIWR